MPKYPFLEVWELVWHVCVACLGCHMYLVFQQFCHWFGWSDLFCLLPTLWALTVQYNTIISSRFWLGCAMVLSDECCKTCAITTLEWSLINLSSTSLQPFYVLLPSIFLSLDFLLSFYFIRLCYSIANINMSSSDWTLPRFMICCCPSCHPQFFSLWTSHNLPA